MSLQDVLASTLFVGEINTLPNNSSELYISRSEKDMKQQLVRRAAFDIGSGETKITVGDLDLTDNHITKIWHRTFKAVELRKDLAASTDKCLSQKIQRELIHTIQEMKAKVDHLGSVQWTAIGTSVFRTANNGQEVLDQVYKETGLKIVLLPQEEEGAIGFASAVAASKKSPEDIIAFDCGNGSFQMSDSKNGKLETFGVEFGFVAALEALFANRGKLFSADISPNPVSENEALELVKAICQDLPPVPNWIAETNKQVICIGGVTSIFSIASIAIGRSTFTKEEVMDAINRSSGKIDDELSHLPCSQESVVAIILLYAIMDHSGINQITYCETNGNTEGLLVTPRFWQ